MNATDNKILQPQRAGAYIRQVSGYRAFIPKPLPPDPPLTFDDAMLDLMSKALLALGRLDGASELLPNADLFVAMYVHKEAVLSSQIEGTQASLIDVLAFESEAAEPDNPQDIEEVVNYVAALNYGLQRLPDLPLSLRLLREIHERLLSGVRGTDRNPGEFRTSQNWIGHAGCTIETARFVPPPPDEMHKALGDIELYLHSTAPMTPLIKIGLIHAQFETVHPFLDGNGRMGRLLITFYLCQQHILRKPLLYLSHFFKLNKSAYYEHLQRVRDNGEWEEWIQFFLTGVYTVAQEATATAFNIVQLRERHRSLISREFQRGAGTALQFLEHLYQHPIITVNAASQATGLVYQNANRMVSRFVELRILREVTHQERNRRFEYADYLSMFLDEGEPMTPADSSPQHAPDMTQAHNERPALQQGTLL